MELTGIPVRAPAVVSRVIDGEGVLVDPRQGIRVLNAVGTRVWTLADGRRTVADLAQSIASEYDVDPERAQADVAAFCDDLVTRGLFHLAGSR